LCSTRSTRSQVQEKITPKVEDESNETSPISCIARTIHKLLKKNISQINFAHKKKGTCEFTKSLDTKQGDFAHSKKAIKKAKQSKK
jgi:hypothetical protein